MRDALAGIRQDSSPGEFSLLASYITPLTPLQHIVDQLLSEPEASPDEWLSWLAETVLTERIDLVWPQAWIKTLLRYPAAVVKLGVPVLLPCRDEDTFRLFQNKDACHAALGTRLPEVPLPWQRAATGVAEVRAALEACRDLGMAPCIKPLEGMYGLGFRMIDKHGSAMRRILTNDTYSISESDLLTALSAEVKPPALLVMEYLAGDERSLDILAWHGKVIASVVRRKSSAFGGRWQTIERDPESEAIAAKVVDEFGLHGVINLQTRERVLHDSGRQPCFLEANLRMSGGIGRSRAAGLNLPLWAVRLALGTATTADVPTDSCTGFVATYESAVLVGQGAE